MKNIKKAREDGDSNFEEWLMSADGGLKNSKSARQHKRQICQIIKALDLKGGDADALLDKGNLKTGFLEGYAERNKFLPGSVKSYLGSVKHWLGYQQFLGRKDVRLAEVSSTVARWMSSYRKASNRRRLEKGDSDLEKLITPDAVKMYMESCAAKRAEELLASLPSKTAFPQGHYVLMRDHLMLTIIIANASRSGNMANMTTEELLAARELQGVRIVSVRRHKTANYLGPAKVIVSEALFRNLVAFVTHVRPQVEVQSGEVFLSWSGKKLDTSQVCKAVQAAWAKGGLTSDLTSTLIRKSVVSAVHQDHPLMKEKLSDLMSHRVEMATKSYRYCNYIINNLTKSTST